MRVTVLRESIPILKAHGKKFQSGGTHTLVSSSVHTYGTCDTPQIVCMFRVRTNSKNPCV